MTPAVNDRVWDALREVYDPELDEPITTLGFVTSCHISPEGDVDVVLQLPTPQCAPNFAFLMAADARRVVRRLPEVRSVTVRLHDHYTGEEINGAIDRGEGFTGAFPGETADDELTALRELFLRKALVARQGRVCAALIDQGATAERVEELRVRDLPDDSESRRCLELRVQLGIPAGPDAPAFVAGDGTPVTASQVQRWLRMARLIATSLEANGGICRSLLQFRHGLADDPEEVRR